MGIFASTPSASTTVTTSGLTALPYATYQATHNDTYGFYKYSNVRYADPPNGTLRFKNPVAPSTIEAAVQDGSYGQVCYQLEQGDLGQTPNQGEDCLFLDVIVPDSIPENTTLPVLFYLFGGGFHSGYKEIYDGSDLVVTSNNSIIYVIPNYRLGSFGWLGQFGDINPGLADQVFAMEWVQSYISLFGGDPSRVTVAGHSAGGGSLITHLISNGGEGSIPFNEAAVMSPAVPPNTIEKAEARNLDMLEYFGFENYSQEEILSLSASQINDFTGHIGSVGWGPIIEGDYYREMPGPALANGRYHTDLPLITGMLEDEAHNYIPTTSPYIIDDDSDIRDMTYDTKELMISFFEAEGFNLSSEVVDQVWSSYPLINDTDLYYTIFGKYDHILSESLFDCNAGYLAAAYPTVYSWYFDVSPAYHAQENPYLFAGGTGSGGTSSYAINTTLSAYMKNYLVGFVLGDVNVAGVGPEWETYGTASQHLELGVENVGMIDLYNDPSENERCVFWQTNVS